MAVKSSDPIDILLEMGIDLDNLSEEEDYLSALKEAIATIQFQTKGGGDDRSRILQEEVIKVRKSRKAADPTFKARKTTIKPNAFFKKQKALSGTTKVKSGAIVPVPKKEDEVQPGGDILKDILRGVNSILVTLQNQNKFTKKQSEKDRKSAERKKRGTQEDKLEKGGLKKFLGGAKKLLKPVTNFFEEIFKFIVNILIGRLLVKIINWMGDKENQKKMDAIQDFFKVTWPAFLAVFLAFSLGLGGFITSLIGLVGGFAIKIAKLIPKMLKGLGTLAMGNPITTAVVAASALAAIGAITSMNQNEGEREKQNEKDAEGTVTPAETRETGEMPKGPQLMEEMTRQTGMGAMYNSGGIVPGSGPNKDTVPAMLSPGEFVMSRGAVNKYGADTMESMNAMGGGTNRPMVKGGVTYAQGGGFAGSKNRPEKSKARQDMGDRKKESSGNFLTNMFGGGSKKEKASSETSKVGTAEQRKMLDAIAFAEGTTGSYGTLYGGKVIPELANGEMTIAEVLQMQKSKMYKGKNVYGSGYDSNATGRYQFMSYVLEEEIGRQGVSPSELFTPAMQDKLILNRISRMRGVTPQLLSAEGMSDKVIDMLAPEFASFPNLIGPDAQGRVGTNSSYYGQGGKSKEEIKKAYGQSSGEGGGIAPSSSPKSAPGSSSGGSSGGGIKYKKPSSSTSGLKINTGPSLMDLYKEQEKSSGRSGTMGNRSDAAPNPAATNVAPSNDLPTIDANAMISQDKIKVLGITVV